MEETKCISVGVLTQLLLSGHINENEYEKRKKEIFEPNDVSRPTLIHTNKRSGIYSPYDLFDDSDNPPKFESYSVFSLPETDIREDIEIITESPNSSYYSPKETTFQNNIINDSSVLVSMNKNSYDIPSNSFSKSKNKSSSSSLSFHINIYETDGNCSIISASPNDKIKHIKDKYLQQAFSSSTKSFSLLNNGEILPDDSTIKECGIIDNDSLFIKPNPLNFNEQPNLPTNHQFTFEENIPENTQYSPSSSSPNSLFSFNTTQTKVKSPKKKLTVKGKRSKSPKTLFNNNFDTSNDNNQLAPNLNMFNNVTNSISFNFDNDNMSSVNNTSNLSNMSNQFTFGNAFSNTTNTANNTFSFGNAKLNLPKISLNNNTLFGNNTPFGNTSNTSNDDFSFNNQSNTLNNNDNDVLGLKDILEPYWYSKLSPILLKSPKCDQAQQIIGINRPWVIPKRENTFKALNMKHPKEFNVVIFGQDPYPRETSATGIAFYDGEITNWNSKLSPSLRNIIKSALMSNNLAKSSHGVAILRKILTRNNILQPSQWFDYTINNGVLWLNTALTFSGKEKQALNYHTSFWSPIIEEIIKVLLIEKHLQSNLNDKGIIFALWGDNAKKLQKNIISAHKNYASTARVAYCVASHPCTTTFCSTGSKLQDINDQLQNLGLSPINWTPKQ